MTRKYSLTEQLPNLEVTAPPCNSPLGPFEPDSDFELQIFLYHAAHARRERT